MEESGVSQAYAVFQLPGQAAEAAEAIGAIGAGANLIDYEYEGLEATRGKDCHGPFCAKTERRLEGTFWSSEWIDVVMLEVDGVEVEFEAPGGTREPIDNDAAVSLLRALAAELGGESRASGSRKRPVAGAAVSADGVSVSSAGRIEADSGAAIWLVAAPKRLQAALTAIRRAGKLDGVVHLDLGYRYDPDPPRSDRDLDPHGNGARPLTDLGPLSGLKALTSLELRRCEKLTDLRPLASLASLATLDLSGCDVLDNLAPLRALRSLTNLSLSGCKELTDLGPLRELTSLQSLDLSGCDLLKDLEPLSGLRSLRQLVMSGCGQLDREVAGWILEESGVALIPLTDLSALSGLKSLSSLDLGSFRELTDLAPLSGLKALASLGLSDCEKLTDLRPLSGLASLASLDLSRCYELTDLGPLSGLSSLSSLGLRGCSTLTDLGPLSGLPSLARLDLSQCSKLADLGPLSGLTSLASLDLSGCSNLTDLRPLSRLTSLTSLDLSSCAQLTDLGPLSGLADSTKIDLRSCKKLKPSVLKAEWTAQDLRMVLAKVAASSGGQAAGSGRRKAPAKAPRARRPAR
jgi:Leucine-rich repeat (LRR) protein